MFSRNSNQRYGLLVDIGSGSVGLAVCYSQDQKHPTIVWEHREHIPLRNIESVSDSSRALVTSLMNSMMEFESSGRTALEKYSPGAKISIMQATVAAPWAYTTTRTIKYNQDEPFAVTKHLIQDLAAAAGQQAIEEFGQQHSLESLGISETSRCALDTYANGYRIFTPNKQLASVVSVTHATALVRTEIIEAIQEMNQKLFSTATLQITSFMLANYFTTRELIPHVYDVCLVDITDEATEIGIVRDGSLQYSTHVAFGRASIAREVAAATKVPLHEAFSSLPDKEMIESNKDLQAIFNSYVDTVKDLFKETGDRLTIPRNIYLQTDTSVESTFHPLIASAAKAASKGAVTVTSIKDVLARRQPAKASDIPLTIAATFFHTSGKRSHFEYL